MNDIRAKLKKVFDIIESPDRFKDGDIVVEIVKTRYLIYIEYTRDLSKPSSHESFKLSFVSPKNKAEIISDLMKLEKDFKLLKKSGLLLIRIIPDAYIDDEVFYFTED